MKARRSLDAATARRLAVEASTDPRTIQRVWCGDFVRGLAGERARAALVAAGLLSNAHIVTPGPAEVIDRQKTRKEAS
ncbi:hypothetical protein [Polyangium aurulentum]|uniref:hypothetical protein n=1 Tax=Polyangium aurulentum TaxID=2567896 RepID=UPI0010ADB47E|nr:hypothetical protein [Polyangium aurulentum]UQA57479.1 hypothetical protein E8A73_040370 [Polyangium aurulentum]